MFLNRLGKEEKVGFLELAHHIARSDNDYDEEKFDIYITLDKIKERRSRKIVLLEIMALIYADDFLHEEERKVLEKVLEEFDLNYNLSIVYTQWAKTMLSLYMQGNALIEL